VPYWHFAGFVGGLVGSDQQVRPAR
jgi:hypothetical protein